MSGKPYDNMPYLVNTIRNTMVGNFDPSAVLAFAEQRSNTRSQPLVPVPPRVLIDTQAGATETIVELEAQARLGLLHDVLACLVSLGVQIRWARTHSYGNTAIAVFYIRDRWGLAISHPQKLVAIRAAILRQASKDFVPSGALHRRVGWQ